MPPKILSGAAKRKRKQEKENYILNTNKKINSFFGCSQLNNDKYKIEPLASTSCKYLIY